MPLYFYMFFPFFFIISSKIKKCVSIIQEPILPVFIENYDSLRRHFLNCSLINVLFFPELQKSKLKIYFLSVVLLKKLSLYTASRTSGFFSMLQRCKMSMKLHYDLILIDF